MPHYKLQLRFDTHHIRVLLYINKATNSFTDSQVPLSIPKRRQIAVQQGLLRQRTRLLLPEQTRRLGHHVLH